MIYFSVFIRHIHTQLDQEPKLTETTENQTDKQMFNTQTINDERRYRFGYRNY